MRKISKAKLARPDRSETNVEFIRAAPRARLDDHVVAWTTRYRPCHIVRTSAIWKGFRKFAYEPAWRDHKRRGSRPGDAI
jgi:hypothetical protein